MSQHFRIFRMNSGLALDSGLSGFGFRSERVGAIALAAVMLATYAPAQDPAAPAAAPAQEATAAPAGEPLKATFIDVAGKVQWRASEADAWHEAQVNDVVNQGVEVRTGLRSRAALRVGRNATVLLDAGTLFQLPTAVQDGDTLRTTAAVKHGRADFKVDKVGLSNDFKVVTPSTTLAVRGTEFAVASGPLKQVEVLGARKNAINAIQLKYALNNTTVQMSGGVRSSSSLQEPAHAGLAAASAPVSATALPSTSQAETVQNAAAGPAPSAGGSPAQATKSNRASARQAAATGQSGGSSTIVNQVNESIRQANERLSQSITYLLQADDELSTVQSQRDTLLALQTLAQERSLQAKGALDQYQQSLTAAKAQDEEVSLSTASFDQRSKLLAGHVESFDGEQSKADATIEAIQAILDDLGNHDGDTKDGSGQSGSGYPMLRGYSQGQQPGGGDGLDELIEHLRTSLLAMGDLHDQSIDDRQAMKSDRDAITSAIDSLESGALLDAESASASYQSILAVLASAVSSGTDAEQVASASRNAVKQLQGLVAALAVASPTAQLRTAAESALARLTSANSALAQSMIALDAVRAARGAAVDDERAQMLGAVEQIYARLVEVRVRVVSEWALADAAVDLRGSRLSETVARAEDVLDGVTGEVVSRAMSAEQRALTAADGSEAAAQVAADAAGREELALSDASGIASDLQARNEEAVSLGKDLVQQFGSLTNESQSALAALSAIDNKVGDRGEQIDAAILSLDAMSVALNGVLSRSFDIDTAVNVRIPPEQLQALAAEANSAMQAIFAADDAAKQQAFDAAVNAGSLQDHQLATDRLLAVTQELSARFGISTEFANTAASAVRSLASSGTDSASRAAAAAQLTNSLRMVAEQDRVGALLTRIENLVDSNAGISEQSRSYLASAQAIHSATSEAGTVTFSRLTDGARSEALGVQSGSEAARTSLDSMASLSSQVVAALDGAQSSAVSAERSLLTADSSRREAEVQESAAGAGLLRTQEALRIEDLVLATEFSISSTLSAQLSQVASLNTQQAATDAKGHSDAAVQYQVTVNRLQPEVNQYGSTRQAFRDAAASRLQTIESADAAGQSLKDQAAFFDEVSQALSAQAKTSIAAGAATSSSDARAQTVLIASQLAASANQARQMEQTASTNAGRLFGRSVGVYVNRAQQAAASAEVQAVLATAAAGRAEVSASTARNLVGNGRGGNSN